MLVTLNTKMNWSCVVTKNISLFTFAILPKVKLNSYCVVTQCKLLRYVEN